MGTTNLSSSLWKPYEENMEIKYDKEEERYYLNCRYGGVPTAYTKTEYGRLVYDDIPKEEPGWITSDLMKMNADGSLAKEGYVSKTQYDLLLFQVSEMRKRLEEVEERELSLIKMLMEKQDDPDR